MTTFPKIIVSFDLSFCTPSNYIDNKSNQDRIASNQNFQLKW